MALVLGAGAYCEWLEAAEILAAVGFSEGQARSLATQGVNQESLATAHSLLVTDAEQLAELSQLLGEHPQRKVILLYADLPLALMAITTQTQTAVKEALDVWQQDLDQLQAFYRKHRSQTLLFELGQVLKHPKQFLQVCAIEWQQERLSTLVEFQPKPLSSDSELSALALQLLQEQPELSQQLQYIQAMAWPLGDGLAKIEPVKQSTYEFLDRIQERKQTQDRLEKKGLVIKGLQSQLQEQKNTTDQVQTQIVELTKKNNSLLQENQLALEQLFLVQEGLEQKITVKNTLHQELEELRDQGQQKEHNLLKEIDAQRNLVKQVKQQVFEFRSSKNALEQQLIQLKATHEQSLTTYGELIQREKDLSQENQLILEQLFFVQDELEKCILAERATIKKIVELQKTNKENSFLVTQLDQVQELLKGISLQQTEVVEETSLSGQTEGSTGRDLVVVSDLRAHAPNHKVPPRSFFERRAHKKVQRLARRKDRERAAQIVQTPWFDADWYLAQYPDIAADSVQSKNPALHYMRMGGFEGRNPSLYFDSAFYLATNPDVVAAGFNPLWHFLQTGQAEGRQPQP